MEAQLEYTSFNTDKSIDELLYIMNQYEWNLKNLDTELRFLKFLIGANIFKPQVRNLFETLSIFDKKVKVSQSGINDLLKELQSYTNAISNKIECEDLECDAFFMKKHNEIEHKIFNVIADTNVLKSEVFEYLRSVMKNV